jgi:hypothetical protein
MYDMRRSLSFFPILFLVSLGPAEKFADTSDVSRDRCVLTSEANGSDEFSRAEMKNAVQGSDSGLEGTTHFKVVSGVPGGRTSVRPASIEFAIAPVENDKPSYSRSIFIKSDEQGKFKVSLPPGKYWLGPKGKALDPINYAPSSFSVSEETIVVKQGIFTKIDVFQLGYAP